MSEIANNICKMITAEIVAKYTKDEIWQEFKKTQAEAGFDLNKIRAANILYQLYTAYDSLSQYAPFKAHNGLKGYKLSTNTKTPV